MPGTFPGELASQAAHAGVPASCDLCHTTDFEVARENTEEDSRILICGNCLLMYRFPQLTPEALDSFYDDTFQNDPGCQLRAGAEFPPDKDREKEERLAQNWGMKIIKRFIEPRGKKILDLRCRTGALTAILTHEGADVIGVEPFQGNAKYAREVRGISNIIDLPFSRFHQFPLPQENYFDMVNILPHHVLAHVLSPRIFLEHVFQSLKPGGYLFLDEKDVLHPVRHKKQSALDSGPAHQYHLTLQTTTQYIESIGFSLLEYELDKQRSSDFRHIRIVAQKPKEPRRNSTPTNHLNVEVGSSLTAIHRRLWWLERTARGRFAVVRVKRKWQRLAGRFFL